MVSFIQMAIYEHDDNHTFGINDRFYTLQERCLKLFLTDEYILTETQKEGRKLITQQCLHNLESMVPTNILIYIHTHAFYYRRIK